MNIIEFFQSDCWVVCSNMHFFARLSDKRAFAHLNIAKTAEKRRAPLFRSTTLELWASAAKSQLRSKLVSGNTCSKTSALLDQAYHVNASISFGVAHRNTTATKEILGTDRQLSCRGRLLSRKMILI